MDWVQDDLKLYYYGKFAAMKKDIMLLDKPKSYSKRKKEIKPLPVEEPQVVMYFSKSNQSQTYIAKKVYKVASLFPI